MPRKTAFRKFLSNKPSLVRHKVCIKSDSNRKTEFSSREGLPPEKKLRGLFKIL